MRGARLALGLLTVVPAGAPPVDRRTAAAAMLWAPALGLALGAALLAGGAALGLLGLGPALLAVAGMAGLALLTRGLHLDGLADTADGLGSGRPAEGALEVMRRSDVGPFGVVVLVLVLLADAAALAQLVAAGWGPLAALAPAAGRLALPLACRAGVPAARPGGLGALVAGSVPRPAAAAAALGTAGALAAAGALAGAATGAGGALHGALAGAAAAAAGAAAALVLLRRCVRRLGGTTGDVLGACVETAQCAALVALVAVVAAP
ncbi:adenosylcobinamide-GDP ribazoletransferase [Vallicoccus soli]|uniref:Adenosylcobinamide-GDP ribazoletransferase n=1 Tax=Vallicoccus soli TaxID=2339232 RepID=A0A3A3Z2K6_9ACTN|nr:adenosylcobinamide-GDP ribazoletransferase [Vallicoccus soli]RJK96919.1 adenosylcobinamide-GDP ribazoletransferase [Vallicoccus soli]